VLVVDHRDGSGLTESIDAAPAGRVALVDRRWIGHTHALRLIICDPRAGAACCEGVLSVATAHRATLVTLLGKRQSTTLSVDAVSRRFASAVHVTTVDPTPLVCGVAEDAAQHAALLAAVADVDEERVRLQQSVKARDSFFTTFCVSPYSQYVARWCARHGLHPNQVTLASLVVAVLAAALCATGDRAGYVAGALLLQASFTLDCVDGQLARYAVRYSRNGAWLDAIFDRTKEYAVFAGLAYGATRAGDPVWGLATVAMALQTTRHYLHFGYTEASRGKGALDSPTTSMWARVDEAASWSVWLRRSAVLPIGERWALISLLIAVSTPRVVFVVLIAAGAVAFGYAAAGRLLRSVRRNAGWGRSAAEVLDPMLDLGPLARPVAVATGRRMGAPLITAIGVLPLVLALATLGDEPAWWLVAAIGWYALCIGLAASRPLVGRFDWLLPAVTRGVEYSTVVVLAAVLVPGSLAAAFALVAATAYRHYDTVYRLRARTAPDRVLGIMMGGHEGRMLVLGLVAAAAPGVLGLVLLVLALGFAATNLFASVFWWVTAQVHDPVPAAPETATLNRTGGPL
jgi:phosphatidylglycerophosphate synthase